MGTVILNSIPFFFVNNNYVTRVFLLIVAFGFLFRFIGGRERYKRYIGGIK